MHGGECCTENPITLLELSGDPSAVANSGRLYTKDVAGNTELFFIDDAGGVTQITFAGGGGTVSGTGAAGRVAFWTAANVIDDDADLLYDSTNNILTAVTYRSGDGSSAAPPYSFTSATDSGMYLTAGNIAFSIANSAKLLISATSISIVAYPLLWVSDDGSDIGASGANRPRSIYWGTQLLAPGGSAANPDFAHSGNVDTGIWFPSTTTIRVGIDAGTVATFSAGTITVNGVVLVGDGTPNTAASIGFSGATNTGFLRNGSRVGFIMAGSDVMAWVGSSVLLRSTTSLDWSNGTSQTGTADLTLVREAAATLQMGVDVNGAAISQTFKAHDGITGTDIAGASLTIAGGRGTGAGAPGVLNFSTSTALASGTTAQTLSTRWSITGSGHFVAGADNSYDIGAAGATRPRSAYLAVSLTIGDNSAMGGQVNLPNTGTVLGRNAANSGNISIAFVDASDRVVIGGGAANSILIANSTGSNLGFFNTAPAARQTSGENLTNNVTSGGTDGTIANYTDLTVYANDAAAIRNDIYQLARKLKQVNDGLRTYGMFT